VKIFTVERQQRPGSDYEHVFVNIQFRDIKGEYIKDKNSYLYQQLGNLCLYISDGLFLDYEHYIPDDNNRWYCDKKEILGNSPEYLNRVGVISNLPGYEMRHVVAMLSGKGFVQIYKDPRSGYYFDRSSYQAQDMILYNLVVRYDDENGRQHSICDLVFARSKQEATAKILAKTSDLIGEVKKYNSEMCVKLAITALMEWMTSEMPLDEIAITPQEFADFFTAVHIENFIEKKIENV
jgi:hypothetical protein